MLVDIGANRYIRFAILLERLAIDKQYAGNFYASFATDADDVRAPLVHSCSQERERCCHTIMGGGGDRIKICGLSHSSDSLPSLLI